MPQLASRSFDGSVRQECARESHEVNPTKPQPQPKEKHSPRPIVNPQLVSPTRPSYGFINGSRFLRSTLKHFPDAVSSNLNPRKQSATRESEFQEPSAEKQPGDRTAGGRRTRAVSGGKNFEFLRKNRSSNNASLTLYNSTKRLFNPDTDDPSNTNQRKQSQYSAVVRLYNPRTHVFRSTKALSGEKDDSRRRESNHNFDNERVKPENNQLGIQGVRVSHPSQNCEDEGMEKEPEILLQPETRPISHEKFLLEVRGIYDTYVSSLEPNSSKRTKVSNERWQAFLAIYKPLFNEHHDISLASEHSPFDRTIAPIPPNFLSRRELLRRLLLKKLFMRRKSIRQSSKRPASKTEDKAEEHGRAMLDMGNSLDAALPPISSSADTFHPGQVRRGLPMVIRGRTIEAVADTGADENFINSKFASELDVPIRKGKSDRKFFQLANGMFMKVLGRIRVSCAFAKDSTAGKTKCWFYVLNDLAVPMIMGSPFLERTKTLSAFTQRLEDRICSANSLPLVNLIGSSKRSKNRLVAFINGRHTHVYADTGSDRDLMSPSYVKEQGYKIDRRRECRSRVRLANNTVAETIGQVQVTLSLDNENTTGSIRVFEVLPGLPCEVLLGDPTLIETEAFTTHANAFVELCPGTEEPLRLYLITYIGKKLDKIWGYTFGRRRLGLRRNFPQPSAAKTRDDLYCDIIHENEGNPRKAADAAQVIAPSLPGGRTVHNIERWAVG